MVTTPQKLTASETVLLAAADLTAAGNLEFSEWDLTVAAWSLDRFRFGLRGYAQSYPDHKRVMMEIMGQKASSPVQQKYLEKVRPNYYRLTPLGKAVAARIRGGGSSPVVVKQPAAKTPAKNMVVQELYENVAEYLERPEFIRWRDNPEEPRDWFGCAAFLGLTGKDARVEPAERLEEVRTIFQNAIDWCTQQDVAFLTRGSGQGGSPIHQRDLALMLDFLVALTYRFPEQLEKATDGGGPTKPKKRF